MTSEARRDVLRYALGELGAVFAREAIWYCLAFGTLLGAVRDGDVIEWDHDIDLFVRPCDEARIVAVLAGTARLEARRVPVSSNVLTLDRGGRPEVLHMQALTLFVDGVVAGELWMPVQFDDGVLRHYDLETETYFLPHLSFPAFVTEELRAVEVRGRTHPVFRHAETVLAWCYGDGWRVPVRGSSDGGERVEGAGVAGDVVAPQLRDQVSWCENQGWDLTKYADQPHWPRAIRGAWGPSGGGARAASTSGSDWWHTLDEVLEHY